jgi:hypothetical protein
MIRRHTLIALGIAFSFATAANAANISGFGGASDTHNDHGTIGIAGGFGDHETLNITLSYQDSDDPRDGIVCVFTNPNDLHFGLGNPKTLTLTVSSGDRCYRATEPEHSVNNVGGSISFNYYSASIVPTRPNPFVGTAVDLNDGDGHWIVGQTVVGTIGQ